MKFTKMHGAGNDYVVLDGLTRKLHLALLAAGGEKALIRHLCDRHYGIGSDGVILVLPPTTPRADFRMRMFNPDGSEAEMCGNGIRCLGKFVYDHGFTRKKHPVIETLAGLKPLDLFIRQNKVTRIRVGMGQPTDIQTHKLVLKLPLSAKPVKISGLKVLLGNPHYVIFVKNVMKFPVTTYGPLIERHPAFSDRTNVEFVQVINRHNIKQRTWERGAGETLACGTGATAAVAAGIFTKQLAREVKVYLKGGRVIIASARNGLMYLTGPAVEVFNGEFRVV